MLILVGVTVTISIDGGLIESTRNAKKQTEIQNEKEAIQKAQITMRTANKNKTADTFKSILKEEVGNKKIVVSEAGEFIEILFEDENRYYEIDENNNLNGPFDVIKDNYTGDITKGYKLDGSSERPYQISCIEDLVMLANRVNVAGNYINANGEIKEATGEGNFPFKNKNFILTRDLNFESKYSYGNLDLKWSYDSEQDAYIIDEQSTKTLKEIITDKDGVGFVPISPDTGSSNLMFSGNLDGQGHTIYNLYENRDTGNAGLFRSLQDSTIKNLTLTGNINAPGKKVGVFSYIGTRTNFYNCCNKVNISRETVEASGFLHSCRGNLTMVNCYNLGKGMSHGGLTGFNDVYWTRNIVNCYNLGTMVGRTAENSSYKNTSGIMGGIYAGNKEQTTNIINTCSLGRITNYGNNFYYAWGGAEVNLENCFYPASMVEKNDKITVNEGSIAIDKNNVQDVLEQLNTYVEEHKNDYEVPLKEWKLETVNGEKMPVLVD